MIRIVVLVGLVALTCAAPVRAHALGASAIVRGGQVEVEAYFSDNTAARGARVTVHDAADTLIAEGITDEQGRWQFPTPSPGKYRVVVDAGAGHRARESVTIPGDATDGTTVSEGKTRDEFTRFPLGGVAAGLTIIGLLALGWRAWRRRLSH